MPCSRQIRCRSSRNSGGARNIAAFALNGLDDDGGHLRGIDNLLEELPLDKLGAIRCSTLPPDPVGAAVGIGIRSVENTGKQRSETLALHRFGSGQRKRTYGASVKGAVESDDLLAPRCDIAPALSPLQSPRFRNCQNRLALAQLPGDIAASFSASSTMPWIVEIRARHVDQLGGLPLDGRHDFGMAVAGGDHGDACGEIEKDVAVHVFDQRAAAAACDQADSCACTRARCSWLSRSITRLALGPGSGVIKRGSLDCRRACAPGRLFGHKRIVARAWNRRRRKETRDPIPFQAGAFG